LEISSSLGFRLSITVAGGPRPLDGSDDVGSPSGSPVAAVAAVVVRPRLFTTIGVFPTTSTHRRNKTHLVVDVDVVDVVVVVVLTPTPRPTARIVLSNQPPLFQ
jgi:hypothetical protein